MRKAAFIMAALGVSASLWAADSRPNIVLILVDDLGYADISANGCKDVSTPVIDSIGENGMRFENGYVTAPQCAPSRAGLMSGMYQERFQADNNHRIEHMGIPGKITFLPKRMKDLGYQTGMVGKWHLGLKNGKTPNDKGFDEFFGFLRGDNAYMPSGKGYVRGQMRNRKKSEAAREYLTFDFAREANKMIDKFAENKKPFFLFLSFNAPHTPLEAPRDYIDKVSQSVKDEKRRAYLGMILALDKAIGDVFENLKSKGLYDNTLVVFLSDNGGPLDVVPGSNHPFRGIKRDTLEGGIHVPFFIQWPKGIKAGSPEKTPVISLDLTPTFMELAGAKELPGELDGKSLTPLFNGAQFEKRKLYWRFSFLVSTEYGRNVCAMREGDMKLVSERIISPGHKYPVKNGDKEVVFRMYDVSTDPGETDDLREKRPAKFREMMEAYEAWASELPALDSNLPDSAALEKQKKKNKRAKKGAADA